MNKLTPQQIMQYVPRGGDPFYVDSRDVQEALKAHGIPVKGVGFEGTCVGKVPGLSERVATYPTVRYGRLDRFVVSQAQPGEVIDGVGLVVYNATGRDPTGWMATRHGLLYVPLEAVDVPESADA